MLRQRIYNSVIAFTSFLNRESESTRGESFRHSQVFPGHVQSPIHAFDLVDSQEYVGNFSSPLQTFHFPRIPLCFLVSLSFVSNCYHFQAAVMLKKKLPLFILTNITSELWVRSNKYKLCEWDFPGNCQIDQIISYLEKEKGRGSTLFCSLHRLLRHWILL